jgi:uncharacterized protein (DUF3084 family)
MTLSSTALTGTLLISAAALVILYSLVRDHRAEVALNSALDKLIALQGRENELRVAESMRLKYGYVNRNGS